MKLDPCTRSVDKYCQEAVSHVDRTAYLLLVGRTYRNANQIEFRGPVICLSPKGRG